MLTRDSAFTERLFQEAVCLLQETREYMQWQAPLDLNSLSMQDSLFLSCEVTRVTARLTEIVAWLLAEKAKQMGQIHELGPLHSKPRLSGDEICIADSSNTCPVPIPPRLHELLDKTRNLYLRLLRLEKMLEMEANENRDDG